MTAEPPVMTIDQWFAALEKGTLPDGPVDVRTNGEKCARCGRTATGYALIGDERYCHGDLDPTPTCYMLGERP